MRYYPMSEVLACYRDEALRAGTSGLGQELANLLLTLPAEYRQPMMIEVNRRSRAVEWKDAEHGRMAEAVAIFTPDPPHETVANEIRLQLAREAGVKQIRESMAEERNAL